MRSTTIAALLAIAVASPAAATIHEVEMRSTVTRGGEVELMVFDPPFLRVEVGDTVRFVPADPGHSVQSSFVPDGAIEWSSGLDETLEVVLHTEGVYLYRCDPHLVLGMVGVLQVGEPVNIEAATEKAEALMANVAMNRDRYARYLGQIGTATPAKGP